MVVVEVGDGDSPLGRYLMPVLGQLDLVRVSTGRNSPVWTEPRTL